MRKLTLLSLFWLGSMTLAVGQELESPNGELEMEFSLESGGMPTYELEYKDETVIEESHLGFELKDAEDLLKNFRIKETKTTSYDETWNPVWGEESEVRNNYNELEVQLVQEGTDREMIIRFRLFK